MNNDIIKMARQAKNLPMGGNLEVKIILPPDGKRVCPFMDSIVLREGARYMRILNPCIEAECKVWNSLKKECGTSQKF